MQSPSEQRIKQTSSILARSLFLLVLLTLILVFITVGLMTGGDLSSLAGSSLIVVVVMLIVLFRLAWKLLRTDPVKLIPISTRIVRTFSNPFFNLLVAGILLESGLFVTLFNERLLGLEAQIPKLPIVVGLWGVLFAIFWLMVSFPLLARLVEHPIWKITTVCITLLVIFWGVFTLNSQLMDWGQVWLDKMGLAWARDLGVDLQDDSEAYWTEHFSINRPFAPYIGYRSTPFDGVYIDINDEGIRESIALAPLDNARDDITIHFYGGSTMWGYGARTEYTIPSVVSQILHDNYQYNVEVTNFSDVGYKSLQDRILFDIQLAKNNIPDIAIFYQGFNDIGLGSMKDHYMGASPNEMPIASIPLPDDIDTLYEYYTYNIQALNALGDIHNVTVVVIWQPTWVYKPLTDYEHYWIIEQPHLHSDRFREYQLQLDPQLSAFSQNNNIEHFLNYADFFSEEDDTMFFDNVHITEEGNRQVGAAIADYLIDNILNITEE
jgi:lysophospholipase L1-like esterase